MSAAGRLSLGIDPGVRALGWALAQDGVLTAAGCSRLHRSAIVGGLLPGWSIIHAESIFRATGARRVGEVFLESMEALGGARATTAQDLIDVQTVGCLTAAEVASGPISLLPASEWKGNAPKDIHHQRILAAPPAGVLALTEAAVVAGALWGCPDSHHKEILDAVGILLYGLRRTERNGTCRKI